MTFFSFSFVAMCINALAMQHEKRGTVSLCENETIQYPCVVQVHQF